MELNLEDKNVWRTEKGRATFSFLTTPIAAGEFAIRTATASTARPANSPPSLRDLREQATAWLKQQFGIF